jgi:hypothetical protein
MTRPRPIAALLFASIAMLALTGCPHRHDDDRHPPPPDRSHDHDHENDHDPDHHDAPH